MDPFDAIVLAGGTGRRLGGVDKADLDIGERSLLDRALDAVAAARRIVVVGPPREGLAHEVVQVREEPAGGGPVAAVAAGLAVADATVVVVLACDMPFVTAEVVTRLVSSAHRGAGAETLGSEAAPRADEAVRRSSDVVMLVDSQGRRQYLAAAYRASSLATALASLATPDGSSMRQLNLHLTVTEVPTDPEVTLDCDTWADVERSRDMMEGR